MTLSDLSIKRPVFAWMLMIGVLVFGAIGFFRLGVSQLPDIDFPGVHVIQRRHILQLAGAAAAATVGYGCSSRVRYGEQQASPAAAGAADAAAQPAARGGGGAGGRGAAAPMKAERARGRAPRSRHRVCGPWKHALRAQN